VHYDRRYARASWRVKRGVQAHRKALCHFQRHGVDFGAMFLRERRRLPT
jgi:hypothetical protein